MTALRRRSLLAATALGALLQAAAAHGHGGAPRDASERERLLADAEAALARGDVAAASAGFERAAASEHAADIELGIVRCHMQAGDYRRALAFASHVAGAHGSAAEGAACYAWLLHVGGQGEQALRVLQQARARGALPALLDMVARRLHDPGMTASALPLRLAPYALGAALPAEARLCGTALLAGDGGAALAPLSAVGEPTRERLWLRDGLGRTCVARVSLRDPATGLALLQLAEPLGAGVAPPLLAARDAFPGSPAFALGHAGGAAEPAWPLLQPGFLGAATDGRQRLGIRLAPDAHRGPVFDAAGRLVGFALQAGDGDDRLVGAGALAARFGGRFPRAPAGAAPRMPVDALYERGLRWGLQLIAQ